MSNMVTILKRYSLTTLTTALFTTLYFLIPIESLYFDKPAIQSGQWFRVFTGHLVHSDTTHLAWNLIGWFVLASVLEHRSRSLLVAASAMGMLAVNLFLYSPISVLDIYCGLSGVLNSLLVVALWIVWQETNSKLIIATSIGSILKIMIEILTYEGLIVHISWPPSPESHLAGFMGGVCLVAVSEALRKRTPFMLERNKIKPTATP